MVNKAKIDVLTDKVVKIIEQGGCPDWDEAAAAHRKALRRNNAEICSRRDASPYAEPRPEDDERRPKSKAVTSFRDIKPHELDRVGLPPEGEEDVPDEIEIPEEDLAEVDPDLEPGGVEVAGLTLRALYDRYCAAGGDRHLPLGDHPSRFWKKFDVPVEEIDADLAEAMAKAVYPSRSEEAKEYHKDWMRVLEEILAWSDGLQIKPARRRHLLPCRHLIGGWVPQRGSTRGSRLGKETNSRRWAAPTRQKTFACKHRYPFEVYLNREQNQTRPDVDRNADDRAAAERRQRREEQHAALLEMPCTKAALQNPELRRVLRREDQFENNRKRGSHLPTHIRNPDGTSAIVNASAKPCKAASSLKLPPLRLVHECTEDDRLHGRLPTEVWRCQYGCCRADGRWSFYSVDPESKPGPTLKCDDPSRDDAVRWYYRASWYYKARWYYNVMFIGYEVKRGRPKKSIAACPNPLAPPPAVKKNGRPRVHPDRVMSSTERSRRHRSKRALKEAAE